MWNGNHTSHPTPTANDAGLALCTADERAAFQRAKVKHQQKALNRLAALRQWEHLTPTMGSEAAAEAVAKEHATSFSRLYGWRKTFRDHRLVGLLPKWRDRALRAAEATELFEALALCPNGLSVALAHRLTHGSAKQRKWAWPESARATQKWWAARKDIAGEALARQGSRAWGHRFSPWIEQSYDGLRPGDMFVADSHECGYLVREGPHVFRPWLVCVMDVGSRLIVGWELIRQPHEDAILAALRRALLDACVPHTLKVDNGREYGATLLVGKTSRRLRRLMGDRLTEDQVAETVFLEQHKVDSTRPEWRGLLPELGTRVVFALPFNARAKAVERFFRRLIEEFARLQRTYCGKANLDRPEILADIERAAEWNRKDKTLTARQRRDLGDVPTLEESREALGRWIGDAYNRAPHDALDGQSPLAVWAAAPPDHRPVATAEALDTLMSVRGTYRVGANGVALTVAGKTIRFGRDCLPLRPLVGRDVLVAVDAHDWSAVSIWEPLPGGDRRFVCVAPANEKIPPNATNEQVREAIAALKRTQRYYRRFATAARENHRRLPDLVAMAQAAEAANREPLAATGTADHRPRVIRPLRTGFEGQFKAAETAMEKHRHRHEPKPDKWATLAAIVEAPAESAQEQRTGNPLDRVL